MSRWLESVVLGLVILGVTCEGGSSTKHPTAKEAGTHPIANHPVIRQVRADNATTGNEGSVAMDGLAPVVMQLQTALVSLGKSVQHDLQTIDSKISTVESQVLSNHDDVLKLNVSLEQLRKQTVASVTAVHQDVEHFRNSLMQSASLSSQGHPLNSNSSDFGVNCATLYKSGSTKSGVYIIQPDATDNNTRTKAYCDMETEGGGWTVVQRRVDGADDFFRGWNSYKRGFGDLLHDHWLGLDTMHALTKHADMTMRIELQDWANATRFSQFKFTRISDESDKYRIMVGEYVGNAGDPFHSDSYAFRMQSMRFSTFDNDNDLDQQANCAVTFTSGWWFNDCFQVNLNGVWYPSSNYSSSSNNGIIWDLWREHKLGYSLKSSQMKLQPDNF